MYCKKKHRLLGPLASGVLMILASSSWLCAQSTMVFGHGGEKEKERARVATTRTATPRLAAAIQSGMAGVLCVRNNSILILDPATRAVSADLLAGEVGSGDGNFDVVITPNGRTALVSSFGSREIFFIDISRPAAPRVLGSLALSINPEDIALTPDGRYALVTDSFISSTIASIHVPTRTLAGEFDFPGNIMTSVAVARDGRTVLCTDVFNDRVHVLTFNPANGQVAYGSEIPIQSPFPINVSISPDGRTAIVAGIYSSAPFGIAVLRIDGPGIVTLAGNLQTPAGSSAGQSVAFNPKGTRAYFLTSEDSTMQYLVHEIAIQGPGQAAMTGTAIPISGSGGGACYFGVDTLAVEPLGRYLFVSDKGDAANNRLAVVNLASAAHVATIEPASSTGSYPAGLAFPEGAADLAMSKSLDNDRPFVGETVTFTVTVVNRGPGIAFAIEAGDLLGEPLSLESAVASAGNYDPETGSWAIGRLDPGRSATLVIKAKAGAAGPFTNEARVIRQSNYDPQSGNNSASVAGEVRELRPLPPAGLQLQRLENDFIFYREYINRLSWQADPAEMSVIASYNVYRKPKNAPDSAYALVTSVAAAVHAYDDMGLSEEQLFTYKLTSVNTLGLESDPATVGN